MRQQYSLYFVLLVLQQYCNQYSNASLIDEEENQSNIVNSNSDNEFKDFVKPLIQQLGIERYQNHLNHKYYHHHKHHVHYLKTKNRFNSIDLGKYDGVEKQLDNASNNDDTQQSTETATTQKTQRHHLHRRHKKRRSLEHPSSVAGTPIIIPKEDVLMVKRSRSSKHLMLTKPYWPWP